MRTGWRWCGEWSAGLVATGLLVVHAPVMAAAVVLEGACWAPDRGTPYTWFENAKDIQAFFAQDYRAAGNLYAYVRNTGERAVTATAFRVDGRVAADLRREQRFVWWRLLPSPLPPGGCGEILVRPRAALDAPVRLEVDFDDGSSVAVEVKPEPAPLRLGTVGFSAAMDQVFLVVERLTDAPQRLVRVELDGRDVTADARFLDAEFASGLGPVLLRLPEPLAHGAYHTYRVTAAGGAWAAACLRTYDGWVPLGSYGYTDFDEYARNGCNGHANFGRHTAAELDEHAVLGMRGITTVRDSPPADYMRGHPGLWAYYLHDEPDCSDYNEKEIAAPLRIGQHAMEMERRRQTCALADPLKLTFLTLDMTFKPANYFIYGPVADVCNVDCYPLTNGTDARVVREVVETCRRGAGARPLVFTFQGCYEEHDKPETRAAQRFPRPPFAQEERLMLYYAVGAGARGLLDYIHCTERTATLTSHGSREYPDLWAEIGRVYRELAAVSPVLALAHPAKLATADRPTVTVSTLVCGADALLLVCTNEDYEQQREAFRSRPATGVRLQIPALPWLTPQAAWRVTEDGAVPCALQAGPTGVTVEAGDVPVAQLLLVSADPRAGEAVGARIEGARRATGAALLRAWRLRQRATADRQHVLRTLTSGFAEFAVAGRAVGAYGAGDPGYWNPLGEPHWLFEAGDNAAGAESEAGAEWTVSVPPERVGQPLVLYAMLGAWGRTGVLGVLAADGRELARREITGGWGGRVVSVEVTPPAAGDLSVRFLQGGQGPKGVRAAHVVYAIPRSAGPPPVPAD